MYQSSYLYRNVQSFVRQSFCMPHLARARGGRTHAGAVNGFRSFVNYTKERIKRVIAPHRRMHREKPGCGETAE